MATARIPILGAMTKPDATGEAWFEGINVGFSSEATPVLKQLVLALADPSADTGIFGQFTAPKDYASGPKLIVQWSKKTAATTNFGIGFKFSAISPEADDMDPASFGDEDNATDAGIATAHRLQEHSLDLSGTTFAVDDLVPFYFFRDFSADTFVGTIYVMALFFEYTTT